MLLSNSIEKLNKILGTSYDNNLDLLKYMKNNKVDVALKIFKSDENISFPQYIEDAFKDE